MLVLNRFVKENKAAPTTNIISNIRRENSKIAENWPELEKKDSKPVKSARKSELGTPQA